MNRHITKGNSFKSSFSKKSMDSYHTNQQSTPSAYGSIANMVQNTNAPTGTYGAPAVQHSWETSSAYVAAQSSQQSWGEQSSSYAGTSSHQSQQTYNNQGGLEGRLLSPSWGNTQGEWGIQQHGTGYGGTQTSGSSQAWLAHQAHMANGQANGGCAYCGAGPNIKEIVQITEEQLRAA